MAGLTDLGLEALHRVYSSEAIYGRADLRPFMLAKLRAVEAAQHSQKRNLPMYYAFAFAAGVAVGAGSFWVWLMVQVGKSFGPQ